MESNMRPDQELAMAERAVAAPWIDTPQPSRWWIPAGALLYGVLVFGIGERDSLHQPYGSC